MSDHCANDTPITAWADVLSALETYTRFPGVKPPAVQVYRKTASTQEIARQHNNWFVALADEQSAGRGRLGRAWIAPPGSAVLMSLRWPCLVQQNTLDTTAYRIAVAVAKAAECFMGKTKNAQVRIKWPNDILVDGKKLAGILIERHDDAAIIGIGFNVGLTRADTKGLDNALAQRITSLAMLGCVADRLRVAAELIGQCYSQLASPHENLILDEWRCRSKLGYEQTFCNDGETITGTVIDLDPAQGLIVRRESGEAVFLPAATTSVVSN